ARARVDGWVGIQHHLNPGGRSRMQLTDHEAVLPGGLRPVDPPQRVAAPIGPHPEHVADVAGLAAKRVALLAALPGGLGDRTHRKSPWTYQQFLLHGDATGRVPKDEREAARE